MPKPPTVMSKNLRSSSELTLIANVKPGLVQLTDPMTHTTRLKRLLSTLFDSRKIGIERGSSAFVGPLERLRSIHFVRWSVFDEGRKLLLAVSFDRPWEPYIRVIVDIAGPILDVIFMHCEGYEDHTTRHGYDKFAEWVRGAQKDCDFYFAFFPELTVDDIRYLKNIKREIEAKPAHVPDLLDAQVGDLPTLPRGPKEYADFFRTTTGLYRLRSLFPENSAPDPAYTDRAIYDRASRALLTGFVAKDEALPKLPQSLGAQYPGISPWFQALQEQPKADVAPERRMPAGVQNGILNSYVAPGGQSMTHGCVVMLELGKNPSALLDFLRVETTKKIEGDQIYYNVGFTPQGLERLGLTDQTFAGFPEFWQGMKERAGLLGDIGSNHPDRWKLPRQNAHQHTGTEVQLSAVDAVLIVQKYIATDSAQGPLDDHLWSPTHPLAKEVIELGEKYGAKLLHVQPLRRYETRMSDGKYREHFGYLDGFSQPKAQPELSAVNPPGKGPTKFNDDVTYGEVLLGHPNDRDELSVDPSSILNNGSFLVIRKLAQNVKAFRQFINGNGELASKLMGRTYDGETLAEGVEKKLGNEFDYEKDGKGFGCPLQSHARLSNPRSSEDKSAHGRRLRAPRIMRKGISYGPQYDGTEDAERGLMFMAYNSSIAQQYEVIQRWLNGANPTGLDSSQRDPISGPVDAEGGVFRFRGAEGKSKTVHLPAEPLTKLEWGMYLFVPSAAALDSLSQQATKRAAAQGGASPPLDARRQKLLAKGQQRLASLLARTDAASWREVLEEQGSREDAFAALAAIKANHRVLRTPMGIMVTSAKEALEVLTQEDTYSARGYWPRMEESHMKMHLGMDKVPAKTAVCPVHAATGKREDQSYLDAIQRGEIDYDRESIANDLIRSKTRGEGFVLALEATRKAIIGSIAVNVKMGDDVFKLARPEAAGVPSAQSGFSPNGQRVTTDLWVLAEKVIAGLSKHWFGMPDGDVNDPNGKGMQHGGQPLNVDDPRTYCPSDFTAFSQYIFRPEPDDWTQRLVEQRGELVSNAMTSFITSKRRPDGTFDHAFVDELRKKAAAFNVTGDALTALLTRSLTGAVDGFVAASFGSFLSVVGQWLANDEFWRVQVEKAYEKALEQGSAPSAGLAALIADDQAFVQKIVGTLKQFAKPAWLHRVAMKDADLGLVRVKQGERVIVHLGMAALDQAGPELLFGAAEKGAAAYPLHACPAKEMAMGVLLGMVLGILELKDVRNEALLTISFEVTQAQASAFAKLAALSTSAS